MRLLPGLLLLALSVPLGAAIFHVDRDVTGGAGDGSAWADAFANLQSALAVARNGDEVWIRAGVYYPDEGSGRPADDPASAFDTLHGVRLYGGFAGTEFLRVRTLPNP